MLLRTLVSARRCALYGTAVLSAIAPAPPARAVTACPSCRSRGASSRARSAGSAVRDSYDDVLRAMVKTFADVLMSAEVDALCGAEYGERSEEREQGRQIAVPGAVVLGSVTDSVASPAVDTTFAVVVAV